MGCALLRAGLEVRNRARGSQQQLDAQSVRLKLVADRANTFHSVQAILAYSDSAMRRAWTAAPLWFARLPAAELPGIDSLPLADASGPTAQYVPVAGGSSKAEVLLNIRELLKPGAKLYLERVIFHEGVPGHHLQITLQQRSSTTALNRVLWSASFVEGWAVYASNLADEMRLYSSEASRFPLVEGMVDDGLTFIVQSGLHAHGWSRRAAIGTMRQYSSDPVTDIEQQVDYFIAAPGHALAYPVGAREIDRLRRQAMLQLNARFDVRRFHDAVLADGPVPLATLRRTVAQWISQEKALTRDTSHRR